MTNIDKHTIADELEHYGFGLQAMEKVKVCSNCGAASLAYEQLCAACGAKLPADNLLQSYKKQSRHCGVCDTVAPIQAQFCPKCGTRLKR